MKYHFKVHKEGAGFWAECIELSGCMTQGNSMEELRKNMQEALNLYIEEPDVSTELATLPDLTIPHMRNIIEVQVDPLVACAFMVRYYRIKHGLTQQEAAKKLGFDNLYSYQRLEANKCNPTLKMLYRIKQAFPEFSIDFALGC